MNAPFDRFATTPAGKKGQAGWYCGGAQAGHSRKGWQRTTRLKKTKKQQQNSTSSTTNNNNGLRLKGRVGSGRSHCGSYTLAYKFWWGEGGVGLIKGGWAERQSHQAVGGGLSPIEAHFYISHPHPNPKSPDVRSPWVRDKIKKWASICILLTPCPMGSQERTCKAGRLNRP